MAVRRFIHCARHHLGNIAKTDLPLRKAATATHQLRSSNGLRAPGSSGFIGQTQAGKFVRIGRRKIEPLQVQHIETQVRRDAFR